MTSLQFPLPLFHYEQCLTLKKILDAKIFATLLETKASLLNRTTGLIQSLIRNVCMIVCVCVSVCAIRCIFFFQGLSLALKSHDQFPAKHIPHICLLCIFFTPRPPQKIHPPSLFICLFFYHPHPPPKKFSFYPL